LSASSAIARSFTHVDPFEDTESAGLRAAGHSGTRFTHVDPFEDTESCTSGWNVHDQVGFTHVDPFEDTERWLQSLYTRSLRYVSPTSIRSRILKE